MPPIQIDRHRACIVITIAALLAGTRLFDSGQHLAAICLALTAAATISMLQASLAAQKTDSPTAGTSPDPNLRRIWIASAATAAAATTAVLIQATDLWTTIGVWISCAAAAFFLTHKHATRPVHTDTPAPPATSDTEPNPEESK